MKRNSFFIIVEIFPCCCFSCHEVFDVSIVLLTISFSLKIEINSFNSSGNYVYSFNKCQHNVTKYERFRYCCVHNMHKTQSMYNAVHSRTSRLIVEHIYQRDSMDKTIRDITNRRN